MSTMEICEPVTSAAAWRGDQIKEGEEWIYHLSPAQIAELEELGAKFVDADPDLRFVQASDYPLDACADAIKEWGRDVDTGRGFVLVRGLKTHLYSDALSSAIYYILGLHMGDPIRQNEMGDLLDHIYATSDKTMDDPTAWTMPWRVEMTMTRSDGALYEYACHEGNYGLFNILAGARTAEDAAQSGSR